MTIEGCKVPNHADYMSIIHNFVSFDQEAPFPPKTVAEVKICRYSSGKTKLSLDTSEGLCINPMSLFVPMNKHIS